jgi:hypothetical protein
MVFVQTPPDSFSSHTVPQPASWQVPAGGPPLLAPRKVEERLLRPGTATHGRSQLENGSASHVAEIRSTQVSRAVDHGAGTKHNIVRLLPIAAAGEVIKNIFRPTSIAARGQLEHRAERANSAHRRSPIDRTAGIEDDRRNRKRTLSVLVRERPKGCRGLCPRREASQRKGCANPKQPLSL